MFRIGSLDIGFPVVQAALSGYSDLPMRRVARLQGAVYALNEVVLDQLVLTKGKKQRALIRVAADDHPVGGQLMGAEPASFALAADALVAAGYDCLDLNFGCPVRKVLGRCRGGFLLSQPATALAIVREVHAAVAGRCPLTVKMRRGMDDSPESEHYFFKILEGVFEIGVDAVTVHPRTVGQRYVGRSDWRFLARVKRHVGDRIVLGSGDLFSAEDCLRMIEQTRVDGVTVARGCIGNPWIFAEIRALLAGKPLPVPPTVAEQGITIRRHYDWAVETYGPLVAGKVMRKFGIKYSELHPMDRQVRDAFIAVAKPGDWQAVLDQWYDPAKAWPPGVRRTGPGHLIAAGAEDRGGPGAADATPEVRRED
ncbi:MAG TPA: tRNA-dihydrouridine synthase [Phycisphaerae bacterium]|nr:tRNA-dihydrouridine synthase [Phycisphaerae bacterium]HRY67516.1 tRNA-dihydrouridine synthase [Phycisphaerae bacterium]HSA24903.1 tRNA-dihydrouridine synthase [Phycisphaerae bacterium]